MFRSQPTYDAEDPFAPRVTRGQWGNGGDDMVATFTISQPDPPDKPLSRTMAGRALHRSACAAGVVGTVYEQSTKVWKRNCTFDMKLSLRISIHGATLQVAKFMDLFEANHPEMKRRMERGYKFRPLAEFGGKPGDLLMAPRGRRCTKFGRRQK